MSKSKKVIDIFPPKKLREYYQFSAPSGIEKKTRTKERKRGSRLKKGLFFTALILIAGAAFLHFVLAKANIEIWPESENLNLSDKVTININAKDVDLAAKVIPGEIFEAEKLVSQQFNSTGKTLKEKKAEGIIRVYNNYSSSQTLVQNTRFQPALEKVIYFRSTKTAVIPSKSYLDIQVKADRAGEEYNIEPTTFSVPGLAGLPQYYSVYGKSFSQMSGGFNGLVNQVKEEDFTIAKQTLLEKLKKEAKDDFASESTKDLIFLDEGISQEVLGASSSVPAGKEADSFNFSLKVKIKAIAFQKSDLDNFIRELIMSTIKEDRKIEDQSLKIDYTVDAADLESGKITLNLKISAKVYADINQTLVKRALFGKSIKESQLLLESQSGISRAKLEVFPPWLRTIPEDEKKINMKLNID